MNIYLTGYMGSGKSTAGKALSGLLNMPFADLDDEFEAKYRISIPDFFEKYSEGAFRLLEHKLLQEFAAKSGWIIATGGGTPCFYNSMQLMNDTGLTVYLKAAPELLLQRIQPSAKRRPLFEKMSDTALQEQLTEHLASRIPFYQLADMETDAANPDFKAIEAAFARKQLSLNK